MKVTEQQFGFRPGTPNVGFVRTIWLLRSADVVEIVDPSELPVPSPGGEPQPGVISRAGVVVADGVTVTRLVPPVQTANYDCNQVLDRNGHSYTSKLSIPLPRPTQALMNYLLANLGERWVAFWQDGNGQGWIVGRPDNGLKLVLDFAQAEVNRVSLYLTGVDVYPARQLETTDLADLFPDPEFDESFDFSFTS